MGNIIILIVLAVVVIGATGLFIVNKGDLRKLRIIGTLNFVAIVLFVSRLVDYMRSVNPALDHWCKENLVFEMVILMGIYVLAAWYFLSPLAKNSPDSRYYHFDGKHQGQPLEGNESGRAPQPMTTQQKRRRDNHWKQQQRKKKHRK